MTAVTPLSTAAGCWAVSRVVFGGCLTHRLTSASLTGRRRRYVAALIYLAMAVITFATLLSVRPRAASFRRARAADPRTSGTDAGSFAGRKADVPELAEVAAEFDRMVDALHRSAADIRRTAEDNAHAFKTPIAVIRQSIEPLRRALPRTTSAPSARSAWSNIRSTASTGSSPRRGASTRRRPT